MIETLVVFLLSAASVADDISIFVDGSHEHAWTDIYETDERRLQFDANYSGNGTVNQLPYPVALVRVYTTSPRNAETPIRVSISRDAKIAVDCENSASTPIEAQAWNRDKGEYETLKFPDVEFQALRPENAERLGPLFRHICGPAWSYNPPE